MFRLPESQGLDLEGPYVSKKDLGVYLYKMNSWQLHLHKEEIRWGMCFAETHLSSCLIKRMVVGWN